jgi:pimeloyl-[acyl-carrier protein] methyl ester esterase
VSDRLITDSAHLYTQTLGQGQDIVLLHGWGMHSGVWENVVESLVDDYRITVMDLPGHGYNRQARAAGHSLAALARIVAANAPAKATWIGWSLGGMIAQRLTVDAPERVAKLVLVSSSPSFVRRPGWPHAMAFQTLHQFAENLKSDYRATLKRFLALEVRGSEHAREQLRLLHRILFQHGEPNPEALQDGLRILEDDDLRNVLSTAACPTLLLLGQRDSLVPACAGPAMQDLLPHARLHVFPGASHAPFFSHLTEFIRCLRDFIDG